MIFVLYVLWVPLFEKDSKVCLGASARRTMQCCAIVGRRAGGAASEAFVRHCCVAFRFDACTLKRLGRTPDPTSHHISSIPHQLEPLVLPVRP